MQIQTWLESTSHRLRVAGVKSARLDALLILESQLKKSREWLLAHTEDVIKNSDIRELNAKIAQRSERIPLAYITGTKEFYGYSFYVDKNVLIPRPETETLIEFLNEIVSTSEINTIIDLGTGSGCLAIVVKLLHPDIHVTAVDVSSKALLIAKKNARTHKVQIQFKLADVTTDLPKMPKTRAYVFLANLPYVPEDMITSTEITKEPAEALFSGTDGLDHYRSFWKHMRQLKNKPEFVITESLETQHPKMADLAQQSGYILKKTSTLAQLFKRDDC